MKLIVLKDIVDLNGLKVLKSCCMYIFEIWYFWVWRGGLGLGRELVVNSILIGLEWKIIVL